MPEVPGAAEVIAAQEAIIRSHQGIAGPQQLPGLAVSYEQHLASLAL